MKKMMRKSTYDNHDTKEMLREKIKSISKVLNKQVF